MAVNDSESERQRAELFLYSFVQSAKQRSDTWAVSVGEDAELKIDYDRYDNWNGGLYHIRMWLMVDVELYARLPSEERERICSVFRSEVANLLTLSENEDLSSVAIRPRSSTVPKGWREGEQSGLRDQGVFSDAERAAGSPLKERYSLGELVGRGGSGSVHRARRSSGLLQSDLAIKFLDPSPFARDNLDKARQRFERELRAVERLQHRGIVHYLDAGIDDQNRPYLVMPYIQGLDLRRSSEQRHFFRRPWMVVQVLEAVVYAHSHNVFHRDLKPSNILVRRTDDQPVVVDWGSAFLFDQESGDSITTSGVGSVGYMPSEVLANPRLRSPQHDIYSCGVILYEVLASQRPIPDSYRPLADISSDLGLIDPIVRRALAPASSRYQTAEEFHRELRPVAVKLHNQRQPR